MADILPPTPVGVPPGSSYWNDWYEKLRAIVNQGTITVFWNNINFTGSNLTDIGTRAHNSLQSIQGGSAGEYNHLDNAQVSRLLTAPQYTEATAIRSTRGVDTVDDLVVDDATQGLVLKDTQATPHYWRVTVSNLGVLVVTDLGTTKP
jgi:hypothetical protein